MRKSPILCRQVTELVSFKVDASAASPSQSKSGLLEGTTRGTVAKTATGVFVIKTVGLTSRRKLVVAGVVSHTPGIHVVIPDGALTKTDVTVELYDSTDAAADGDFTVTVLAHSFAQEA